MCRSWYIAWRRLRAGLVECSRVLTVRTGVESERNAPLCVVALVVRLTVCSVRAREISGARIGAKETKVCVCALPPTNPWDGGSNGCKGLYKKAMQIFCSMTNEAVRNGSIKKVEKRGNVGETSKDKNGRDDNKRARTGNAFATTVNPIGRENTGTWPNPEQSAFISGRQILDGPLILSEIIDWYKKRNKKLMLFKVDFEKAFDYVSWRYLDYVLDKLGFGIRWRNWIKNGLMSARTSILINGNPSSEFSLKRGLRQGDPLSPFLFIIAMEGLHMALNDGIAANMFHGVKIGSNIHLSHLFYADDVIILSEWNQSDMENIIRILNVFYIASGLKINIHKSNVFGVGVSSSEIVSMADCTGCEAGGRMNLIKSVLGSLGIYYLSIFKAPESVVNSLESKRAAFFGVALRILRSLLGYNRLFHLANSKDCSIQDRIANGSWNWDWNRPLATGRSKSEFDKLILDIANLDEDEMADSDSCIWSLSHDGIFSVNMVRKFIDDVSLPTLSPSTRWYTMIPKKVNIFMWLGMLNRMLISSSSVTRPLLSSILFDLGLILLSLSFARVKTGILGLIRGVLLRTKSLGLIPSSQLLAGLSGVIETISHSTLIP
ncbi:RNA-directed DNA polymerase, eukaryota, reverse transcriptase zinc-binding domain protein [Tanacetum coccineum]